MFAKDQMEQLLIQSLTYVPQLSTLFYLQHSEIASLKYNLRVSKIRNPRDHTITCSYLIIYACVCVRACMHACVCVCVCKLLQTTSKSVNGQMPHDCIRLKSLGER